MLKDISRTVGTHIASLPIGMITGILTARFLGPSDRGLYTLLVLIPTTATVFVNMGIGATTIYFHNKEKEDLSKLFANSVAYSLVAGLLASVALWFFSGYLIEQMDSIRPAHLLVALTIIPLRLLNYSLTGVLKAKKNFNVYNMRALLEATFMMVGMVIVFLIFDGGLLESLFVYPVALVLICAWLLFDIKQYVGRFSLPDIGLLKRMLFYGVKSYAQMLARHVHFRADVYLVAFYLTNSEIAFYSIGTSLAERLLLIPTAVTLVLFPRLASLPSESAAQLTARVCRNLVVLSLGTAVTTVLLARPLIQLLYGAEYVPAVSALYILVFGTASVGITRVLVEYMKSVNKHQYNVLIVLCAAVANIFLNLILIPRFGIVGAACSSLVTYTLQAAVALVLFVVLSGIHPGRVLIPRAEDIRYWLKHKAYLERSVARLVSR